MNFFQRIKNKFSPSAKDKRVSEIVERNSKSFFFRFFEIRRNHQELNKKFLDELEELLISYDLGFECTQKILKELYKEVRFGQKLLSNNINQLFAETFFKLFASGNPSRKLIIQHTPTIYLVMGVNGSGKTSTCAKLANYFKEKGKKVLLVAADTFRAVGDLQLKILADQVGVDVYYDSTEQVPTTVVYKALENATNYEVVIIDTAGRLHNNINLVNELAKLRRVISKKFPDAPHETFLILDATIGQNSIKQAESFVENIGVTALILTKLDGLSKGGAILNIKDKLGIEPMFVTTGESLVDIAEFNIEWYVYQLIKDFEVK